MKPIKKISTNAKNAYGATKTQVSKTFDYAKKENNKLKKKIDLKIQKKAVSNLKAELAMRHKTFDDYNDEELEIMLSNEKSKIKDNIKDKTLIGLLAILGLDLFF